MKQTNLITVIDEQLHVIESFSPSHKVQPKTPPPRTPTTGHSIKRFFKQSDFLKKASGKFQLLVDDVDSINQQFPSIHNSHKQETDFKKRLGRVLKNNDGRDISNLINTQNLNLKTTSSQNQTLTNFYVSSKVQNMRNNFYAKITMPTDLQDHNIYAQGLKDSNSLFDLIGDLEMNTNSSSQKKFHKLEMSEQNKHSHSHSQSDIGQFMKARKEVTNLQSWIQKQFQLLSTQEMPIKQFFDKKLKVVGSVLEEIVVQVSRDCKERGSLLKELLKMVTDLYHGAFKALESDYVLSSEDFLKQQVSLHKVYQVKLEDQQMEIDRLKRELIVKSDVVDKVVKDNRYLRKMNKKFERLLKQQNFDLSASQKEYADLFKENIRLLMKYYEIDEQTAKELKKEYRKINNLKVQNVNFKAINEKVLKSVSAEDQVYISIDNYAQIQDTPDDMSDSDQEVKNHSQEIADKNVDTSDFILFTTIGVDTRSLIKTQDYQQQYKYEPEVFSIGIQEVQKTTSKFTNTFIQTQDQEVQYHRDQKTQSNQTEQIEVNTKAVVSVAPVQTILKPTEESIESQDDHDQDEYDEQAEIDAQKARLKKYRISIVEEQLNNVKGTSPRNQSQSQLQFENEYSKLEDRHTLMEQNTKTLLILAQKENMTQDDIVQIQELTRTNQLLLQEMFNQTISSLHIQKKSLILKSEVMIRMTEQKTQIEKQQATITFLRNDMAELQELTADMDVSSKLQFQNLITTELEKLPSKQSRPSMIQKSSIANQQIKVTQETILESDITEQLSSSRYKLLDTKPSYPQTLNVDNKTVKKFSVSITQQSNQPSSRDDPNSPRVQNQKKGQVKITQVVKFNLSERKKFIKHSLQAECQNRASQLLYESIQSYQISQHVAKNKKKILSTMVKSIQPLFNDLFRMIKKQEDFKFPVHVFLYTLFINKFGLMKVSEKNFTQIIHHLYQCQDYAPCLTFIVQLLGINLPLAFIKQIPQDKNLFYDMLGTHGYIHFLIFKWLNQLNETINQNVGLDQLQTNSTKLLEFLNKNIVDSDPINIIHRMKGIVELKIEKNTITGKVSLVQSPSEYLTLNLFSVGSALYYLLLEEYNAYCENVQYIFGVLIDRNKITFADFKTFLDSFEPQKKRSSNYLDILLNFMVQADTTDDMDIQSSMTIQKLTAFCWMHKLFSQQMIDQTKDQFQKINSLVEEEYLQKMQVLLKSFKWFLFQHSCFTPTYQKLLSFTQTNLDNLSEDGGVDVHNRLELCEYIMTTKIEDLKSQQIINQYLPTMFNQISDSFNRSLINKSKQ